MPDEDANVKKERRKRKYINGERGRGMERQRGRGGDVCCAGSCFTRMTDVFVCRISSPARTWPVRITSAWRVSITTGWALPPGSSQQKRALPAPLCLFMCNLSFSAVTSWCYVTFCVFISTDWLTSSDKRPFVAPELCFTNPVNLCGNF